MDAKSLVRPSAIMLEFLDQDDFGGALDMEFLSESLVDEKWTPLWGKSSFARNHYREYRYRLSELDPDARYLDWIIRVYDDGVAFRYSFPEDSGFGEFRMDPSYQEIFKQNNGKSVYMNGHTQIRAGVTRPKIILSNL